MFKKKLFFGVLVFFFLSSFSYTSDDKKSLRRTLLVAGVITSVTITLGFCTLQDLSSSIKTAEIEDLFVYQQIPKNKKVFIMSNDR